MLIIDKIKKKSLYRKERKTKKFQKIKKKYEKK